MTLVGERRSIRLALGFNGIVLCSFLVTGCQHDPELVTDIPDGGGRPAITSVQTYPRPVQATFSPVGNASARSGTVELRSLGTGSFINQPSASALAEISNGTDGFTLNFVNAEISDVAKAILGDILHVNYVVDGAVQGSVTLRTSRPVPRNALLGMLEASLRMSGAALIRTASGYRIVALTEATHQGNTSIGVPHGQSTAGFAIDVIPLRYISASDMMRLLAPLSSNDGQIKIDEARNLVVVSGTSQERAAIADTIALFDVDYLSGMSFSLFHLQDALASSVASELKEVMGGKSNPLQGMLRFVVIDRLNSILVITSQPRYLDQVRGWINRLDQVGSSDQRQLFVYNVQNGRSRDLADVLNRLFGSSGGQSSNENPTIGSSGQGAGSGVGASISSLSAGGSGNGGGDVAGQPTQANDENPLLGGISAPMPPVSGPRSDEPRVTSDDINNAALIYCTPSQYRNLEDILVRLDIPPKQVMLEAAIAEVDLNDELNFGVQYFFQDSHNMLNTVAQSAVTPTAPGLAYTFSAGQNIKVILDALSTVTKVKVISSPKVLVLNNQPAQLEVGDDVPITTQSSQSTSSAGAPIVNSVQYRATGVIFRVTPRVNQGGLVEMDVSQEVSNVAQSSISAISPTFTQRKIRTTVAVQDGETVALGGLITDNRTNTKNAIPYLSKIPYLGQLFSQRDDVVSRTELLVLITPHVVQSMERLRVMTDELRRHMGEVRELLER